MTSTLFIGTGPTMKTDVLEQVYGLETVPTLCSSMVLYYCVSSIGEKSPEKPKYRGTWIAN